MSSSNEFQKPGAIAIFSARESLEVLTAAVEAAVLACGQQAACIDVLVNGNRTLTDSLAACIGTSIRPEHQTIRVWYIAYGDKANAWNTYLHDLWPGAEATFFIDGYVRVRPDALRLLAENLRDPAVLAATGVPTMGASAGALREQMLAEGGIHGNLFALSAYSMQRLREIPFRLPRGIYRTDSTIGAVLSFNFDPSTYQWEPRRIYVNAQVTWDRDVVQWHKAAHMLAQVKRMLRQALGLLENAAVRNHLAISKRSPGALAETVDELLKAWMQADGTQARQLFCKHPLSYLAWKKLEANRARLHEIIATPVLAACYPDNSARHNSEKTN